MYEFENTNLYRIDWRTRSVAVVRNCGKLSAIFLIGRLRLIEMVGFPALTIIKIRFKRQRFCNLLTHEFFLKYCEINSLTNMTVYISSDGE